MWDFFFLVPFRFFCEVLWNFKNDFRKCRVVYTKWEITKGYNVHGVLSLHSGLFAWFD